MKKRKVDVLGSNKISKQSLSDDLRAAVEVLGGLDIFTDAHVLGVTNTTTRICERMQIPYEYLKFVVLCAYLHDVGKIKVPSEILQKNGKLTDEEFQTMKNSAGANSEELSFVIPAGKIMVMGDNRDFSFDSRYWGPLPDKYLKGKALVVYWPINRIKLIS